MEEFESSSRLGIRNGIVQAKFRRFESEWKSSSRVLGFESEMEEFESNSGAWNREWKSSSQVRGFESEMEEFEPSSDPWNWEWNSSSQVRGLESGME